MYKRLAILAVLSVAALAGQTPSFEIDWRQRTGYSTYPTPLAEWIHNGTDPDPDQIGSNDLDFVNTPAAVSEGLDFELADSDSLSAATSSVFQPTLSTHGITMCTATIFETVGGDLMTKNNSGGDFAGYRMSSQGGELRLHFDDPDTGGTMDANGNTTLTTGVWYLLCATSPAAPDVSEFRFYLNGASDGLTNTSQSLFGGEDFDSTGLFSIGSRNSVNLFHDGIIGISALWFQELSAPQIADYCNSRVKPFMAGRSVTITCP